MSVKSMPEDLQGKYRIVEFTYEDNHKSYLAQYSKHFLGLKYWKRYVYQRCCEYGDYWNVYCMADTYEKCLAKLREKVDERERDRKAITVKSKEIYE